MVRATHRKMDQPPEARPGAVATPLTARRATELRRQHRARFEQLAAKVMDRAEALLDRLPSTQQKPAPANDLSRAHTRRQLAHIVRAPLFCSRKICRRTHACCGEPKHCLSMFLPLLPPEKIAELLLDARKTRRGRPGQAPARPNGRS